MPKSGDVEIREGVVLGLLAYALWGIFPIYFKWIDEAIPTEVLVHRVVWAVPFGGLIILFRRQLSEVWCALSNPGTLIWLACAALAISCNWWIYIWAVTNGHILDTSIGYYINPMMYVLVGVVFFAERLRSLQLTSVILATLGVVILTISLGRFPWVALALAALFTVYGIIRRQVAVGAMPGLFIETLILLPFAVVWLFMLMKNGEALFYNSTPATNMKLMLAGPVSVLPLLLFAIAAKRLSLTTIGFMQFLGPTIQFFIAIYYGETITAAHMFCFVLIWLSVAIFMFDALTSAKKMPLPINPTGA